MNGRGRGHGHGRGRGHGPGPGRGGADKSTVPDKAVCHNLLALWRCKDSKCPHVHDLPPMQLAEVKKRLGMIPCRYSPNCQSSNCPYGHCMVLKPPVQLAKVVRRYLAHDAALAAKAKSDAAKSDAAKRKHAEMVALAVQNAAAKFEAAKRKQAEKDAFEAAKRKQAEKDAFEKVLTWNSMDLGNFPQMLRKNAFDSVPGGGASR